MSLAAARLNQLGFKVVNIVKTSLYQGLLFFDGSLWLDLLDNERGFKEIAS